MIVGSAIVLMIIGFIVVLSNSGSKSPNQLSEDQLRAGDCLTGSDLGLGTSAGWPDVVTAVPCTRRHTAEIFFAAQAWPRSKAYPGEGPLSSEAQNRCTSAFGAYVRQQYTNIFTWDYVVPDAGIWNSGGRLLVCIAYDSTTQYPGGTPVAYSIGSTHS
jgi:hypothetical protein